MAAATYEARHLINGDRMLRNACIRVEGETVAGVECHDGEGPGSEGRVAEYAIPGFIDIHTHGAVGHDLMDGGGEALRDIARFHLAAGTTTFLGSTLTTSLARLAEFLSAIRPRIRDNRTRQSTGEEAWLAGVHLEGPWISRKNLGAQNPHHVIEPDEESLRIVEENADIIRMVTFSCHTPGAEALLRLLVRLGIVAASGHDEAVDEEIVRAFEGGLSHLSHIYSNSSSFQRRNGYKHLGSLEMALMTDGVSVEVIADGRHITRHFWDFIRHNKSVDDIMIVSDSTRGAGLPEDPNRIHSLGGLDIVIDDGVAWLSDRSVFAGSTSTMLRMFRILVREWDVGIQDAVKMASCNQARKFGLTEVEGGIIPGKRADILFLDRDLNLVRVVKSGVELEASGAGTP